MTVDGFLAVTAERMPTAAEVVSLCAALGWTVGAGHLVGVAAADRELAMAVAALIKREPLRSAVLAAVKPVPEPEPLGGEQ